MERYEGEMGEIPLKAQAGSEKLFACLGFWEWRCCTGSLRFPCMEPIFLPRRHSLGSPGDPRPAPSPGACSSP